MSSGKAYQLLFYNLPISMDRTRVRLLGRMFSGSCKEYLMWCGTTKKVFYCDGKLARYTESEKRFRRSTGRFGPALQNRVDKMPTCPVIWDSLAHFFTVMRPAMWSEMEDKLTQVRMGWISEFGRLSLMRVKKNYVLNASAMSTVDSIREVFDMMKFGKAK